MNTSKQSRSKNNTFYGFVRFLQMPMKYAEKFLSLLGSLFATSTNASVPLSESNFFKASTARVSKRLISSFPFSLNSNSFERTEGIRADQTFSSAGSPAPTVPAPICACVRKGSACLRAIPVKYAEGFRMRPGSERIIIHNSSRLAIAASFVRVTSVSHAPLSSL